MPQTTPQIKVQAVMDLGGEVVLHGDDYDAALSMRWSWRASATWCSCIPSTIRT